MYQNLASTDMSYDEFKKMCFKAWKKEFGFLTIKMDREKEEGKYCYDLGSIKF